MMNFECLSSYPVDELLGKVQPPLFGEGFRLRKKAAEAFDKMKAAALEEGLHIHSESSYRSYVHQERIWNRKYGRFTEQGLSPIRAIKKIIEYSTIPGTSRHHWGTDLDLTDRNQPTPADPLLARHFEVGGCYDFLKKWLDKNANSFDFYEVYTNAPNRKGFNYEPWHFSYKPLSQPMLREYRVLELKFLLQKIKLNGADYFTDEFVAKYRRENVLDINRKLL